MMFIEHTGNPVESETVKLELVDVKLQVRQKESQSLIIGVVEKSRVPKIMITFSTTMKQVVVGTIEHIETIIDVFGGVRMDNIEKNSNTQSVSFIDQLFQLLGITITRRNCKKVGHLVSKGCVVGMLHDGHQLNGVVAQLVNNW